MRLRTGRQGSFSPVSWRPPASYPQGMVYPMLAERLSCLRSRKTFDTLELSFLVGKVGAGVGLNSKPWRGQWLSGYSLNHGKSFQIQVGQLPATVFLLDLWIVLETRPFYSERTGGVTCELPLCREAEKARTEVSVASRH